MFRVLFLNARLIFFFFFFEKHTLTRSNCFTLPIPLYIYIKYTVFRSVALHSRISANASIHNSRNSKSINALLQNCIPNNFAVKHLFFHSRPETFYAVCTIVFYRYWLSSRKGNLYPTIKKIKNYPSRNCPFPFIRFSTISTSNTRLLHK